MNWRCFRISKQGHQINEEIRDREVRLVSETGEQLGIMSARDALERAIEANLDLVKISPTATSSDCKPMDYGKYKFEPTKRAKEAEQGGEVATLEKDPKLDGRHMSIFLSPKAAKEAKKN